jgi:hypothetical protein
MFSTPVATPDYTPAKEMLAQISANGADPEARNLAMQEYNRLLKAPINSVPQDVIDAEERLAQQKDAEDLRQLDIAWKGIRPGVDVSGDSEYVKQRAELVDRQNRAAQDRNAQRNYQYTEANQNRRLSAANTLAQLDQSQKQQIMQMAQLTVDEINAQFGLDLQSEAEKAALFEGLGQVFAGGAGTANNPGGAVQIYMGGAQ